MNSKLSESLHLLLQKLLWYYNQRLVAFFIWDMSLEKAQYWDVCCFGFCLEAAKDEECYHVSKLHTREWDTALLETTERTLSWLVYLHSSVGKQDCSRQPGLCLGLGQHWHRVFTTALGLTRPFHLYVYTYYKIHLQRQRDQVTRENRRGMKKWKCSLLGKEVLKAYEQNNTRKIIKFKECRGC